MAYYDFRVLCIYLERGRYVIRLFIGTIIIRQ